MHIFGIDKHFSVNRYIRVASEMNLIDHKEGKGVFNVRFPRKHHRLGTSGSFGGFNHPICILLRPQAAMPGWTI